MSLAEEYVPMGEDRVDAHDHRYKGELGDIFPGKEEFARLCAQACFRLGFLRNGHPHIRRLSAQVANSPITLQYIIESKREPTMSTLRSLAKVTGTPLEDWFEALGYLPPRAEGGPRFTSTQQRLFDLIEGWSDEDVEDLMQFILRLEAKTPPQQK